jgi:hypothetical protein
MLTGGSLSGNRKGYHTAQQFMTNPTLHPDEYKWTNSRIFEAADKLVQLKKDKDPWEVFEYIVKIWKSTNPSEYESFIVNLNETKTTRKVTTVGNKQFSGVSVDKNTGGTLRYLLDIPVKVVHMIRKLYPEMNLDKEFYTKWAKHFPKMVIEKVV